MSTPVKFKLPSNTRFPTPGSTERSKRSSSPVIKQENDDDDQFNLSLSQEDLQKLDGSSQKYMRNESATKVIPETNINVKQESHEITQFMDQHLNPDLIYRYLIKQERAVKKSEKVTVELRKTLKKYYVESNESKEKIKVLENQARRLQVQIASGQGQFCKKCKQPTSL
jgi:hypothetical protein